MSVYEPSPPENWQSKEKFIKWLDQHINEQITKHLIQRTEEEL